jgi:hypothetical protein
MKSFLGHSFRLGRGLPRRHRLPLGSCSSSSSSSDASKGNDPNVLFWEKAAKDIAWVKEPKVTLDDSKSPFSKW